MWGGRGWARPLWVQVNIWKWKGSWKKLILMKLLSIRQKMWLTSPIYNRKISTVTNNLSSEREKGGHIKHVCYQCKSSFTVQSSLNRHKQSKHEEIVYGCNQCDYNATTKGDQAKHMQSIHGGVRYECHQCDHRATTQSSVTVHRQSIHEGVRYEWFLRRRWLRGCENRILGTITIYTSLIHVII